MTTSGNADTADSTTSSPVSPESASASTRCKTPNAKGWTDDGAWLTCPCGWYTFGHASMREAKRRFTQHKWASDPLR